MKVICGGCQAKLKIPEAMAGKKVRCPRCKGAVIVPVEDLPWGELDEGESVHEAAALSVHGVPTPGPAPRPGRPLPSAPPAVPAADTVTDVAPTATVNNGNPFAFDPNADLSDAPAPAKRGKRAEPTPEPTRRKKDEGGQGLVRLSIGIGVVAVLCLIGAGVVFYLKNRTPTVTPAKPTAVELPAVTAPAPTPTAPVVAAAKPSAKQAPAAKALTARGTGKAAVPTSKDNAGAAMDPDNPSDPGDGKPIPIPGLGAPLKPEPAKKGVTKKEEMKKDE